ncbi:MAG: UDP-N-acetylmuramoyl-tripeptide--D-alanyl-D-alanine ligase [Planctomycetes bacterium]|nr:UDP-N-acetylmuramoyl-tripeptide--D-alanyl-D-alanine ligase [Planctomycetota bacterium]
MITLTADDLLAATGGRLLLSNDAAGRFPIQYEPDSTSQGDVFLAFQRRKQRIHYTVPSLDTHDSLAELFSKGCRRFIIDQAHYDDPKFRRMLEGMGNHEMKLAFVIVVDSGIDALFDLATFVRQKINPVVVAITGSVGKTSTTEMVNAILSLQGKTLKNTTWNSNTATSRALIEMALDTKYATIELSTRRTGLMQIGSRITRPDIAIITQIQHEHVRGMGDLDGIAKEKLSIATHMPDGAPLILPDIPVIRRHVRSDARVTYIQADAFQTIAHDRDGYAFAYRGCEYRLNVPGRHNVVNALSAIEACLMLGLSPEEIARGLDKYRPLGNRWLTHNVSEDLAVINDCPSNPSPASTKAAIETLVAIYPDRQKIVILSNCLELGDEETALHEELGRFIDEQPVDVVITFGEIADTIARTISNPRIRVKSFREPLNETKDFSRCPDQIDFILDAVREPSAVLVKAQRITGFDKLPALLVERLQSRLAADSVQTAHGHTQEQTARATTELTGWRGSTEFLDALRRQLQDQSVEPDKTRLGQLFENTDFPKSFWAFAMTLYQPGVDRLMVVRAAQGTAFENVRQAMRRIPEHPRFGEFDLTDWRRCRMQVDFIVDEPQPIELSMLSDSVLPDEGGPLAQFPANDVATDRSRDRGARHSESDGYIEDVGSPWQVQVSNWAELKQRTRFELGVDGLRIVKEGKRRYFLPGDAFVRSILGIGQLRRHIQKLFPGDDIEQLTYYRFRSLSFVSGVEEGTWLPLYRGSPPVPEVNGASLTQAARAGTQWIADNLQSDGRFIYYYDVATDTCRDHEHPKRDPNTDPYYNLLRHSGAVITLLLDEQLRLEEDGDRIRDRRRPEQGSAQFRHLRQQTVPELRRLVPAYGSSASSDETSSHRKATERACNFFAEQLVTYKTRDGNEAAYALYNRKAKLGGSGIGLYSLALFQRLLDDKQYAIAAKQLARHLVSEINDQGEFRYYHIYLDEPVTWNENQRYFSFYYPGEAILGLSHYCQHVCQAEDERRIVYDKTHQALRFLLRERPRLHQEHYQTLPSDSWLMMGINDLWDVAEFQQDEYKKFVFDDADQMVRLMYTAEDALYPDYVGSFYYHYGDHPYPDGARAEGLLGAYQLALKVRDQNRIERYRDACYKVAWATLRLCNTPDSVYSAANPDRAIGGIRFKLTRQWFRIDTIQHVASFYLKMLATETP